VDVFELRPVADGLELSGGELKEPLKYPDRESAIRLVGFLSQRRGSELRIFDATGALLETQRREPTTIMEGAVGGLAGP
jgi:hypothetical protein